MLWKLLNDNKDELNVVDPDLELIFGSLQNNSKERESEVSVMETEKTAAGTGS